MKALSFLCKKINISLFDDTLTVYKKKLISSNFIYDEIDLFFHKYDEDLEATKYINPSNTSIENHQRYHDDQFSPCYEHYHVQFEKTIDKSKLEKIVSVFIEYGLISDIEGQDLLSEFSKANELNNNKKISQSLDLGFIKKNKGNNIKKIEIDEDKMDNIFGFRTGFLNNRF